MKLDPPLKHGSVEVTSINEELQTVHFVVHVIGKVEDLATMEFGHKIHLEVNHACKYLLSEGYLTAPLENWLTHVAAVLHKSNEEH
jgi:hypothetical protein